MLTATEQTTLLNAVKEALYCWQKPAAAGALRHLLLWHTQGNAQTELERSKKLLVAALEELRSANAELTEIIYKLYLEERTVGAVANQMAMSEPTVNRRKKEAVEALTSIIARQERDLQQQRSLRFEARLEPPSNDQLFGVAEVLEKLTTLLYDTNGPWMIALEGMGGIGKTSLANRLIRQAIAGSHFEEFGWISARRHRLGVSGTLLPMLAPTLTSDHLIEALARQLLAESELPLPFSVEKALNRLQMRFKQTPHLVVIDNLETVENLERLLAPLQRLLNPSKFVLTTRHNLHNEFAPYQFIVPPLDFAPAAQLIRHDARRIGFAELATADDADLRPIYAKVGGNPLALRLVVGQMRVHSLPTVLKNLQTAQGTALEQMYRYLFQDAWQALDETNRQVWLAMLLLPENGGEVQQISEITEQEASTIAGVLDHLASLNLIEQRGNLFERRYTLHSVTRTFLQQIADR